MVSFMSRNHFVNFLLEVGFFQNTLTAIVTANNPAKHTNYINDVFADVQCSIMQVPNQTKHSKRTPRT